MNSARRMQSLTTIKQATIDHAGYISLILILVILTFFVRRNLSLSGKLFRFRIGSSSGIRSPQSSKYDAAEKGSARLERDLWSNADVFELEKRAIFNKTWFFVIHRSRFEKAGDYFTFVIGNVSFFIILGKDKKLRAFHNICRHRAYTVIRKSCGSSLRLSCKYHGWQYDSTGYLVKAPKFEDEKDFHMEENGLYEIQLWTSDAGSIFINFESGENRSSDVSIVNGWADSGLRESQWIESWEFETDVNWKLASCGIRHSKSWEEVLKGWSPEQLMRRLKSRLQGIPNYVRLDLLTTLRRLDEENFRTVTLVPLSAGKTLVRCSTYRRNGDGISRDEVARLKRQIRFEFSELEKVQALLMLGDSCADDAQIDNEGNLEGIMNCLRKHQEQERDAGKRLYPASKSAGSMSVTDEEAMHVLESLEGLAAPLVELDCPGKQRFGGKLDW